MRFLLAMILSVLSAPALAQERAWSPSDVYCAAAKDVASIPHKDRCRVRYVYVNKFWDSETLQWILSYHFNALSTEAGIELPVKVDKAPLLRVDLSYYGPQWIKVWEQLAVVEPFYHLSVVEVVEEREWWPGGVWNGRHYDKGWYKTGKQERKKVTGFAPWVKGHRECYEAALYLSAETKSGVPLVDGAWFLWQTSVQADRKPGYYDFVDIKDQKDYERLIGFDAKLARDAKRVELLEGVGKSTVTEEPRRIAIFDAISGRYYRTFDNRVADDGRNPLRVLDGTLKFDATEVIGHLPNDLLVWGLFDDKGVRQDSAPDFIASDSTAHGTDRRVHINLSCIRCHVPDGGLKPVDGWVRGLYQGRFKLRDDDPDKERLFRQQYLRDLEEPLEEGRRKFKRAVAKATNGRTPAELAARYGGFLKKYDSVTVERAASDVGLTKEDFIKRLEDYYKVYGTLDPSLAIFLTGRKEVYGPVQWHEAFPLAMLVVLGKAPVQR